MNCEQAKELTILEMSIHDLLDKGWTFKWMAGFSTAGYCLETDKTISLSKTIVSLETEEFVLDTIRHEIAHALVGCHNGHNKTWQHKAKEIGCDGKCTFAYSEAVETARLAKVKYVIAFEGKICKTYTRKPNRNTIATIRERWMPKHKEQTLGYLSVETYNPDVHVEYFA